MDDLNIVLTRYQSLLSDYLSTNAELYFVAGEIESHLLAEQVGMPKDTAFSDLSVRYDSLQRNRTSLLGEIKNLSKGPVVMIETLYFLKAAENGE